ncbi:MAG: 30S ribosomal protein S20 [bacterium]|nr:30S ribosomal protein S20 [bacterium]
MPNIKAAKKDLKQSRARAAVNLTKKKELKETIKAFKKALDSDKAKAGEMISDIFSKLDKAAKNNLIARNKAARLKSRLSKKLVT